MAFSDPGVTRLKVIKGQLLTKTAGANTQSTLLPRSGLLARILLRISATVSGTVTGPNALGMSSLIGRIRLLLNSGVEVFNVSGAGYSYLLQEAFDSEYFLATGQNQGRTAVSVATFNLDAIIPLMINQHDPVGLILLQNQQLQATLSVEFAAEGVVATGGPTIACTVQPYYEFFTVPNDPANLPNLLTIHRILEDQVVIAGAGDYQYNWLRGNPYIGLYHGAGIGVAGTDNWTAFKLRINQSDYVLDIDPNYVDMSFRLLRGRARAPGAVLLDFMATTGLGMFEGLRDIIDTGALSDIQSVITFSGAGTLYNVRNELIQLPPAS